MDNVEFDELTPESEEIPVRQSPKLRGRPPKYRKELHSEEFKIPQPERVELPPIDETVSFGPEIITPVSGPLINDEAEKLAFNEEPVTIVIHRSGLRDAPLCTDLISNNGIWAEMLINKKWVRVGYLPRGQKITVKRKTVEALATSKVTTVNAGYNELPNQDPRNWIDKTISLRTSFSVIEDRNPKGAEWLSQLIQRQG